MRRAAWIVAALAVVIVGWVWLTAVYSFNALWLVVVFVAVMFVVWRWRSGGDLGLLAQKEERWEAAPGWTPPSGHLARTAPRWVRVTAVVVLIAAGA